MSCIKNYFLDNLDKITNDQLKSWGWSEDDIKFLRESCQEEPTKE